MRDICPKKGISVEKPRGVEGVQRRAAEQCAPAGVSLRGSARPRGRDPQRGRRAPEGAGAGGRGGGGWARTRRLVDGTRDAPARRRL